MNSIPLRAYNREIEEAIEQKQYDEAIAHCRHILQTYPKHIETYRLLGKAYLESQRYGNAADLFQRVLSSVPNDFISHVGMSIIREDESNLDAAIWHMERAFESQPYNGAIQGELRRLYGLRDGVEPPKIRLTRGALARMYAKGNLYEQAIAELRSTLAEDPNRADLQVLLADMYAKNGQPSEAIEVCSSLIKRLPYCLEANRLLIKLLPEPERSDEIKICKQRLVALDPYEAHISPNAPRAEDVPDQAVMIPRLDWDGGTPFQEADERPEWATAIGADVEGLAPEEDGLPSWLAESPTFSGDRGELRAEDEDSLPPWIGETSDERILEEAAGSEDSTIQPEGEALDVPGGDIPEWLQEMAPSQSGQDEGGEEITITAEDLEKDLPEWLDEEADGATDTIIEWLGEKSPEAKTESGDEELEWLQDIEPDTGAVPAQKTIEDETPSWLQELSAVAPDPSGAESEAPAEAPEETPAEPGEIPEWLQGLGEAAEEPQAPAEAPEETPAEPAEIPEWLQGLGEAAEEPEIPAEAPEETPAEPAEVPEWLQGLGEAAEEPKAPAEAPEETPAEPAEIPEWLQGLGEAAEEPQAPAEAPEETSAEPAEVPEWLQGLGEAAAEPEAPAEASKPEPGESIEVPEWLQGLTSSPQDDEEELLPFEAESKTPSVDMPEWLKDVDTGPLRLGKTTPSEDQAKSGEIPDWLEALRGEGAAEAETISSAKKPTEPLPQAEPPPEPPTVEGEPSEMPEWLHGLGESAPPSEEAAQATSEPVGEESERPEAVELEGPQKGQEGETADVPEWMRHLVPEGEREATPEAETKPEEAEFESAEEALAWLESLAAKQGVSEEELITQPEERPDTPPEWVFEAQDKASEEMEAAEDEAPEQVAPLPEQQEPPEELPPEPEVEAETPEWLAKLQAAPEEEKPTKAPAEEPAEGEEVEFSDADAAMAWLESLAAKQGVSEEELITRPEDRPESPPEWVLEAAEEESVESTSEPDKETTPEEIPAVQEVEAEPTSEVEAAPEIPEPTSAEQIQEDISDELPSWLRESLISEAEQEPLSEEPDEVEPATPEAETISDELPEWLRDALKEQGAQEETEYVEESEPSTEAEAKLEAVSEELPEWLRYAIEEEPEQPVAAEEPVEPLSEVPAEEEETTEAELEIRPEAPIEGGMEHLQGEVESLELNEASLAQLERLPAVGFRRAQAIVAYREEHGPFEKLEDLLNVPGIEEEVVEALRSRLTVTTPEAEGLPTISTIQVEDEWHALQLEAQADLKTGNYSHGLKKYATLIKKSKRLEDVIADLEDLQYEVPNDVCVDVLQTLGDAYVKIDELQKALDTYSKAEDLLR